jgi:hypothetical protein
VALGLGSLCYNITGVDNVDWMLSLTTQLVVIT